MNEAQRKPADEFRITRNFPFDEMAITVHESVHYFSVLSFDNENFDSANEMSFSSLILFFSKTEITDQIRYSVGVFSN